MYFKIVKSKYKILYKVMFNSYCIQFKIQQSLIFSVTKTRKTIMAKTEKKTKETLMLFKH